MLITKRDGSKQSFDLNKILKSVLACFEACEDKCYEVESVVNAIVTCIKTQEFADDAPTVLAVQECTERTLIEYDYHEAAAAFMDYRIRRDHLREVRRKPDADALSEYIHQAKYARWNPEEGRRETYSETVDRVIEMHYAKFCCTNSTWSYDSPTKAERMGNEITNAFRFVYDKAVLPSMRSMQFAGPAIEFNNARMYNCCFTHIDRDRVFSETLFLLLSGCGVGYSVQWEHVDMLPVVSAIGRTVYHHTIGDTIEGWAEALRTLVFSYLQPLDASSDRYVEFDYSKVRPEGLPLRVSGGRAPGHLGLKAMLEEVRLVLDGAVGRKLRPIECHDMMCYIARSVLSGGIRRSSMVSLFSPTDTEMMYAKARGVFVPGTLNSQREMANNAAALLRDSVTRDVFKRIFELSSQGFGDPGFVFVDSIDYGINPCAEIVLNPRMQGYREAGFAFCNLSEINAATCGSKKEFLLRCEAASIIGTLQACFSDFKYLSLVSTVIADRDRLIGVSITGIMDNPDVLDWMHDGRIIVKLANERIAKMLGINKSIRTCCIKPSGTASLLLGTSSGIHTHHARRYLRRVICNRTEVVARAFINANPHMIEEKPNGDYCIVFPVQARDDAIVSVAGYQFVKTVREVIATWCDGHNVSCTVPVRSGDSATEMFDYIWNNRDSLSSLSFAPVDISKRYPFSPLEAVDDKVLEAYWDLLIKEYKPVNWINIGETENGTHPLATSACDAGRCEK